MYAQCGMDAWNKQALARTLAVHLLHTAGSQLPLLLASTAVPTLCDPLPSCRASPPCPNLPHPAPPHSPGSVARLQLLINNAGAMEMPKPFGEVPASDLTDMFTLNAAGKARQKLSDMGSAGRVTQLCSGVGTL